MAKVSFEVPDGFRRYVEPLLMRLGYLHPTVTFSYDPDAAKIHADWLDEAIDASEVGKEIRYQLYRERIYAETLPIRTRLYGNA